jgi:hypothetical protein
MTIPPFPTQLLSRQAQWHNGANPSTGFYYLTKALYDRTGGASGVAATAAPNMTVSGGTSKTQLTNDFTQISAGTNAQLAVLQPGQFQLVLNSTAGPINVYPAANGSIDALGVNAPYVLAAGKSQLFWCSILTNNVPQYHSLQLG